MIDSKQSKGLWLLGVSTRPRGDQSSTTIGSVSFAPSARPTKQEEVRSEVR